ncbi:unnamed protein product [Lupinus luteus]|uniref:Uncharacterized protein n=1 Tax=Lupinus luteus TaxID=3873 RepID=A0AAV1W708_LUPLU
MELSISGWCRIKQFMGIPVIDPDCKEGLSEIAKNCRQGGRILLSSYILEIDNVV